MRSFFAFVVVFICIQDCFGQLTAYDSSLTTSPQAMINSSTPEDSQSIKNKYYEDFLRELLSTNKNINYSTNALPAINVTKRSEGKEWLFYLLAADILLLGLFKVFYSKYFNNIFRVFLNTSFRQHQLTDILLQARLPSLIFNLFFIVNAGLYTWIILSNYALDIPVYKGIFPLVCIGCIGLIYTVKFFTLKIVGWVTGMADPADTYIFVIFLINKIIGITLLPFIVLLAFAPYHWEKALSLLSFAVLLLLFLLRFYRSYGLLENQFTVNRFHFFIYVLALEIIPVLILYKIALKMISPV